MDHRSGTDRRRGHRVEHGSLRSIVERMADGIVIVSLDGIICFVNPAAEQLFARAAHELIGTPFGFPLVVGESTEIEIIRPPGGGPPVSVELRVVDTDWDGRSARLVSLRDVTDRKRAEERTGQLDRERVARAEAEAASQAKSEFLAMMSHELRTPLNAVIGYAELLDLGIAGPLTPEQRYQISRIRAGGRHLLALVNEVLDLAKVEAGRLAVHVSTARASHATDSAIALVQPAAEARAISISAVASADPDATYDGDEDRVRQILVNLLNNAVKFTEPGGSVTVECCVATRAAPEARLLNGPWVCLSVTDTGIGIPDDRIASIFDPFVQVKRGHTRPADGSGLGLTISRRLARLMKGDLTVRSAVGKGSCFTLWLPASDTMTRDTSRRRVASPDTALRLRGLADMGEALVRELDALLQGFVTRLRTDTLIPTASALRFSQLADHVGAFVADVGSVLIAVEEARGQPSTLVQDGSDIQRLLAERHGAQRAQLGWTSDGLRREWQILAEEIERAMRRGARTATDSAMAEALTIVSRLTEKGEELSGRALNRGLQELRLRPAPIGA